MILKECTVNRIQNEDLRADYITRFDTYDVQIQTQTYKQRMGILLCNVQNP